MPANKARTRHRLPWLALAARGSDRDNGQVTGDKPVMARGADRNGGAIGKPCGGAVLRCEHAVDANLVDAACQIRVMKEIVPCLNHMASIIKKGPRLPGSGFDQQSRIAAHRRPLPASIAATSEAEADNIGIGAVNMPDECRRRSLNGVTTSLSLPVAGGDIGIDLGIGQPLHRHAAGDKPTTHPPVRQAKGNAAQHPMAPP